ncbi:MAG: HEAT repeat domain-containing protein [Sandaracinaceae bacterium]
MASNPEERDEGDLPVGEEGATEPVADLGAVVDDDAALRKIRGRTTLALVGAAAIVIAAVALGSVAYLQNTQSYETRWDAYHEAQEHSSDQDEFLGRITTILDETTHEDVELRILEKLAEYRYADAVPQIAAKLRSPLPTVRIGAARALAQIGTPGADSAREALLAALPDTTEGDRAAMVWALAVLQESRAEDAIIEEFASGRLQGQPGFDPKVIAEVLGLERLSSEDLLTHDELPVRTLTALSLAEIGTPEVVDPLSRLIEHELGREDPDENVLQAAAAGLGRTADARAAQPLLRILEAVPRLRAPVLESLDHSVGAPGIGALITQVEEPALERELLRIVARNRDPRAGDVLEPYTTHEDDEYRRLAVFGMAEIGDPRAVPGLLVLARHADLTTARRALDNLRINGVPEAAEGLLAMLQDEEYALRKASILRALGATGDPDVGPAIMEELKGDDVASAAIALAELDYDPAYEKLLDEVPRPERVDMSQPNRFNEDLFLDRKAAINAMGRYGRPDAAQDLMDVIEDPLDDRRLRLEAGYALGAVADAEIRRTVVDKVRDDELDEFARRYYVAALWQVPDPDLVPDLLRLIEDSDAPTDVRTAAAVAVGYANAPDVAAAVSRLLESPDTRREAAYVIILSGTDEQARRLSYWLAEDDELARVVREDVLNEENNRYNLLTAQMFENGQIFRRLRVAYLLNEGEGGESQGYAWNHILDRLKSGWDGHDGLSAREVREKLWEALHGDDPLHRELVAEVYRGWGARGLLMAARDMGGQGSEEAREVLRQMNNPEMES